MMFKPTHLKALTALVFLTFALISKAQPIVNGTDTLFKVELSGDIYAPAGLVGSVNSDGVFFNESGDTLGWVSNDSIFGYDSSIGGYLMGEVESSGQVISWTGTHLGQLETDKDVIGRKEELLGNHTILSRVYAAVLMFFLY